MNTFFVFTIFGVLVPSALAAKVSGTQACPNDLPGIKITRIPSSGLTFDYEFTGDDADFICGEGSSCTCSFEIVHNDPDQDPRECLTHELALLGSDDECEFCAKVVGDNSPCAIARISTNLLLGGFNNLFIPSELPEEACLKGRLPLKPKKATLCIEPAEEIVVDADCPGTTEGKKILANGIPADGDQVSYIIPITVSGETVNCDLEITGGDLNLQLETSCPIDLLNSVDVFPDGQCELLPAQFNGGNPNCKSTLYNNTAPLAFSRENLTEEGDLKVCFSTVKEETRIVSETLSPDEYNPDRRYQAFLQRYEELKEEFCSEFPAQCASAADACDTCLTSPLLEIGFYTTGSLRFSGFGGGN